MGLEGVEGLEQQYGEKLVETNLLLDKALEVVTSSAVVTDPDAPEGESGTEGASETESGTEE